MAIRSNKRFHRQIAAGLRYDKKIDTMRLDWQFELRIWAGKGQGSKEDVWASITFSHDHIWPKAQAYAIDLSKILWAYLLQDHIEDVTVDRAKLREYFPEESMQAIDGLRREMPYPAYAGLVRQSNRFSQGAYFHKFATHPGPGLEQSKNLGASMMLVEARLNS